MRSLMCVLAGLLTLLTAPSAAAQPAPPPGRAVNTNYLVSLDFAATPVGDFPTNITMLDGVMEVVDLNGRHMLRASARSAFLIRLPQVLPSDFTVEVDFVPKLSGNEDDFGLEGTPEINQGTASAYLLWHSEYLRVIGGDVNNFETKVPDAVAVSTQGVMTRVTVTVQGTTMKVYTNGRLLSTLSNRRFVRGPVLRVFLGGQDDGAYAVHLAALRIIPSALSATAVVAASNPLPPAPPGGGAPAPQPGTLVTTIAPTSGTGMTASGASTAGTAVTTIAPTSGTGMTTNPASSTTTPSPSHPPATNKTTASNVPVLALSVGPRQGWGADVSWPTFPGTVQHVLERRVAGQAFSSIGTIPDNPAGNFKADVAVRNGTHYDYQVKAVDGNGTILAISAIQGIDTPAQYPTVTNLAASVGAPQTVNVTQAGQVASAQGAMVTYSWDASPFIGNQFATLEHIATDASGQTTTVRSWNMLHQVQPGAQFGVAAGTSARFCVAAVPDPDDATNLAAPPSCITTAVSPTSRTTTTNTRATNIVAAPTLTVTPTPGGIEVKYSQVTGAQSYTVCRESPPGAQCQPLGFGGVSVLNGVVSGFDLGLPAGTTHAYRVRAVQSNGQYGEGGPVSATVGALSGPTNVRVTNVTTASPATATVQWDPVAYTDYTGTQTLTTYEVSGTGLTNPLTVTGTQVPVPLSANTGTYHWAVKAVLPGQNGSVHRSAASPVTYVCRYRIVALGVVAQHATGDNALTFDGAQDEFYVATAAGLTNRAISSPVVTMTKSSTFGDVAGFANRIKAGSATPTGGIQSGDGVPSTIDINAPAGALSAAFPLLLWEGPVDDQAVIVLHSSVWEADTDIREYLNWVNHISNLVKSGFGNQAQTVQGIQQLVDAADFGPVLALVDLAGGGAVASKTRCSTYFSIPRSTTSCVDGDDRPIGLVTFAGTVVDFWHEFLVFTRAAIEKSLQKAPSRQPIAAAPFFDPSAPGVIVLTFRDGTSVPPMGSGDYRLILKVERIP